MENINDFIEYFDLKFTEYQNKIGEGFYQIDEQLDKLNKKLYQTIYNYENI